MAIQVSEAHLLRIDSVHFEDFRGECWVGRLELALLHFSLGSLGDHGGVQASEETVRLFDLDLPRELSDELAQRAELLIFVPNDLDKGVPVRDQTYIKYVLIGTRVVIKKHLSTYCFRKFPAISPQYHPLCACGCPDSLMAVNFIFESW